MTTPLTLTKAERKKVKIKIALNGVSGSGKTYSALLLAYGLTGDWSKIALIDTENRSGSLYAHLGGYSTVDLKPPFTPERYTEAIKICEAAGIEAIVIDSLSHEWVGSGGCLEANDALAQSKYSKNSWSAWNETTPRHRAFLDKILQCKAHVIATMRSKMDTAQEEVNGKKKIVKLGMKAEQRDGTDYEFTLVFDISQDHIALASKDRTGLFQHFSEVITEDTGKKILEWCNAGIDEVESVDTQGVRVTDAQMVQMQELVTELGADVSAILGFYHVDTLAQLTQEQAGQVIAKLSKKRNSGQGSDGTKNNPPKKQK